MKQRVIFLLSCAVIIAATGFLSCKKSSSPPSQASNNKANILGNWADSVFIDASGTGPVDTLCSLPCIRIACSLRRVAD